MERPPPSRGAVSSVRPRDRPGHYSQSWTRFCGSGPAVRISSSARVRTRNEITLAYLETSVIDASMAGLGPSATQCSRTFSLSGSFVI